MKTSFHVSRCGAAAVAGLAAFALAACGSSSTPTAASNTSSKPSTTSTAPSTTSSSPAPAAAGKDRAVGLIGSVSGGVITVTGADGSTTVDVTPSTRVSQVTASQLTDVSTGECVAVRPTKDSGGPPTVTAAAVLIGPTPNGRCGRHPGGQAGRGVVGTVASVGANSITLAGPDSGQRTVTITATTHYSTLGTATSSAIVTGECLVARGTKDGGTLQATSVTVRQARGGRCGGKHQ